MDAINLQSSRDAAALWAYDLVMREDVTNGFRDLVVTALQMDPVINEAQELAVQVVNRVLSDEQTILEAKRVLRDALEDQELRNSAKEGHHHCSALILTCGGRTRHINFDVG